MLIILEPITITIPAGLRDKCPRLVRTGLPNKCGVLAEFACARVDHLEHRGSVLGKPSPILLFIYEQHSMVKYC